MSTLTPRSTAADPGGPTRRGPGPEHRLEHLRPLGQRYVIAHFSGQFNRQDAEDIAAQVVIRLYERLRDGMPASNLNALFFTSVHNRAIDTLRARGRRPEVDLEAAAPEPATGPGPEEIAESSEDFAVIRELLERMNPRYRQAVLMRFGLGLSMREIAERTGISAGAAKKLVNRGTRQAERRLLAIRSGAHCEEMVGLVRRGLFVESAAELASEEDRRVLERHLAHCGECKTLMANLQGLHELAGTVLLTGGAADAITTGGGFRDHLATASASVVDGAHAAIEKARLAAFKATSQLTAGDASAAGALTGSAKQITALCATGAAATACVGAGVVGPGVEGIDVVKADEQHSPAVERPVDPGTPVDGSDQAAKPEFAKPPLTEAPAEPDPKPVEQAVTEFGPRPNSTASSGGGEFGGPSGGGDGASQPSGSSGGGFGIE